MTLAAEAVKGVLVVVVLLAAVFAIGYALGDLRRANGAWSWREVLVAGRRNCVRHDEDSCGADGSSVERLRGRGHMARAIVTILGMVVVETLLVAVFANDYASSGQSLADIAWVVFGATIAIARAFG
jgi:hypothetical protein